MILEKAVEYVTLVIQGISACVRAEATARRPGAAWC